MANLRRAGVSETLSEGEALERASRKRRIGLLAVSGLTGGIAALLAAALAGYLWNKYR